MDDTYNVFIKNKFISCGQQVWLTELLKWKEGIKISSGELELILK